MTEPRTLRLDTAQSTLLLITTGRGVPELCHFGRRLHEHESASQLAAALERPVPQGSLDRNPPRSVFAETGTGFAGYPALMGDRGGRDWTTGLETAGWDRLDEVSARLTLTDPVAALPVEIEYRLDDTEVLTVTTRLRNDGDTPYRVDWLAGICLPLPARFTEVVRLRGRWCQEFQLERQSVHDGAWLQENRRGRTSHDRFPGFFVGVSGFTDEQGGLWGVHLGWSGNHRALVERLADGVGQLQLGELFLPGEVELAPGASLDAPPVYLTWSDNGLNTASQRFHDKARRLVHWSQPRRPRPVTLNTWEAIYFDHEPQQLQELVQRAARVGVERFVLDDGWFRGRNDERTGLGDWYVDERKYPAGLTPLIESVRERGMQFGLWVEPEMVSPGSELFRHHPDWVLGLHGREQPLGRYQYVLDLTRREVREYLLERLDALLSGHAIDYLKRDMNRDLTHPGSACNANARAAARAQIQGLYALLDELRRRHPAVEIESCASGGGRVDFGILSRTHRFWPSDCNDPLERQSIQRGFGLFLPAELMGAHVGADESHTTERRHTLEFRAMTALFGHMGIEQDLRRLDEVQLTELADWIALHKRFRPLLHGARQYRVDYPEPGVFAHGVVAPSADEALFCLARVTMGRYAIPAPLRLPGLDPTGRYRVRLLNPPAAPQRFMKHVPPVLPGEGALLSGEWLAVEGVQLPIAGPETASLVHCRREEAPSGGESGADHNDERFR